MAIGFSGAAVVDGLDDSELKSIKDAVSKTAGLDPETVSIDSVEYTVTSEISLGGVREEDLVEGTEKQEAIVASLAMTLEVDENYVVLKVVSSSSARSRHLMADPSVRVSYEVTHSSHADAKKNMDSISNSAFASSLALAMKSKNVETTIVTETPTMNSQITFSFKSSAGGEGSLQALKNAVSNGSLSSSTATIGLIADTLGEAIHIQSFCCDAYKLTHKSLLLLNLEDVIVRFFGPDVRNHIFASFTATATSY